MDRYGRNIIIAVWASIIFTTTDTIKEALVALGVYVACFLTLTLLDSIKKE